MLIPYQPLPATSSDSRDLFEQDLLLWEDRRVTRPSPSRTSMCGYWPWGKKAKHPVCSPGHAPAEICFFLLEAGSKGSPAGGCCSCECGGLQDPAADVLGTMELHKVKACVGAACVQQAPVGGMNLFFLVSVPTPFTS